MKIKLTESKLREMVSEVLQEIINENFNISDYINLNELTDDDIRYLKIPLSFHLKGAGYDAELLNYIDENYNVLKTPLFESDNIEITQPYEKVKYELQRVLGLKEWQIHEEVRANKVKLILLLMDISNNADIVIKQMNLLGWTKSQIRKEIFNDLPFVAISFDPMFQENVFYELKENNIKYLFHCTPQYNVNNILKQGLLPKSLNSRFDYPDRVHLIKGNVNDKIIIGLAKLLYKNNNNPLNNGMYSILRINVNNLPDNFSLFYDPRFEYGYYTKEKIPANAIELYADINFNK